MNDRFMTVPRRVVVPLVFGIVLMTWLVAGAGMLVRPWLASSFDALDASGVGHADIDVLFRHAGHIGAAILVAAAGIGATWLVRKTEVALPTMAWFTSAASISMVIWVLWIGLVAHNTYLALFTR